MKRPPFRTWWIIWVSVVPAFTPRSAASTRSIVRALGHYDRIFREEAVAEIARTAGSPRQAIMRTFQAASAAVLEAGCRPRPSHRGREVGCGRLRRKNEYTGNAGGRWSGSRQVATATYGVGAARTFGIRLAAEPDRTFDPDGDRVSRSAAIGPPSARPETASRSGPPHAIPAGAGFGQGLRGGDRRQRAYCSATTTPRIASPKG